MFDSHRQLDASDVVQAVWIRFFTHPEKFGEFQQPWELVAYLSRLADQCAVDEIRRRLGSRSHGMACEQAIDDLPPEIAAQLAAHEPSPEEAGMAKELSDWLLQPFRARDREIAKLKIACNSFAEIAACLRVSERTVRRVWQRIRRRLQKWPGTSAFRC